MLGCSGRPPDIRVSAPTGGSFGPYELRCTVREVHLDDPLAPAASTTIGMDIEISLPKRNDRFGWTAPVAYAGTAIPVLAAETGGGLHLDPYTDTGESYFAPVGDFRVLTNVIVFGPLSLLRRLVMVGGLVAAVVRVPDVRVAVMALSAGIAMLAFEPLLERAYSEQWRALLPGGRGADGAAHPGTDVG